MMQYNVLLPFMPFLLAYFVFFGASAVRGRAKFVSNALLLAAPLLLCLSLLDRGADAGLRWSMSLSFAYVLSFICGEVIWEGEWLKGRAIYTFAMLGLISLCHLSLIPSMLFKGDYPPVTGLRWWVWRFAALAGACSLVSLARILLQRRSD